MKIAIVGNSHLGALVKAHRLSVETQGQGQETNPNEISFWGVAGPHFFQTEFAAPGQLINSSAKKVFSLGQGIDQGALQLPMFDALVFHAEPAALPWMYANLRGAGMNLGEISSAFRVDAAKAFINSRRMLSVLRQARDAFDGPILATQQPMWRGKSRRAKCMKFVPAEARLALEEDVRVHLAALGIDFVPQDPTTRNPRGATLEKYSITFEKAGGKAGYSPLKDPAHMGVAYGTRVMEQISTRLSELV